MDTRTLYEHRTARVPVSGAPTWRTLAVYVMLGLAFGLVLVQSEVLSWYRIQEMFRFESFRMYGIIGSAVATAALSLALMRRFDVRAIDGEPIRLAPKQWGNSRLPAARYILGGLTFGLGWALLGACPGPIFALVGTGATVMLVALAAAVVGTWTYGVLRPHLPH